MSVAPGAVEGGAKPVAEAQKPAPAGPQKVEGPQAVQADALASAAESAGSPDKKLGVLASGAKNVMNFFKGSVLTEAQSQNPKADTLPDPFDGKSVTEPVGGSPKDAAPLVPEPVVPVAGESPVAAAAPTTTPGESSASVDAPQIAEAAPVEPAVGEKALAEINGLLGDGILTKDSKADDLMGQLVAKGWKNDADTLNYVQGAIDTARANAPAESTDSGQPESSEAQTTEQGSENQTAQSGEAQPKTPEQQLITKLQEQVNQLTTDREELKAEFKAFRDDMKKAFKEVTRIMELKDGAERKKAILAFLVAIGIEVALEGYNSLNVVDQRR